MLKILNWRMKHQKNDFSLQKKTAPLIIGGAMLNPDILTLFIANASYLFFLRFFPS